MEVNIMFFVFFFIYLAAVIIYVSIRNSQDREKENQEKENRERDIELIIYKKEMERLEEQLRRKEISEDNYEILRKNLEELHQKNMAPIRKT